MELEDISECSIKKRKDQKPVGNRIGNSHGFNTKQAWISAPVFMIFSRWMKIALRRNCKLCKPQVRKDRFLSTLQTFLPRVYKVYKVNGFTHNGKSFTG